MKHRLLSLLLAAVMLVSLVPAAAAADLPAVSTASHAADALHTLGLFQGTGANADGSPIYALERTPSRLEALTMLVRVLGLEKQALGAPSAHPFTDVQPWADPYVGYAYQNGLTKGVSPTSFGDGNADAAQYLTFVLRALGYSDAAGGDFNWSNPFSLATQVGIVPQEANLVDFRRADVALISYAALNAKRKGSDQTLAQKLLDDQAFTQAQYDALVSPPVQSGGQSAAQNSALTAAQISEKCAPAVFYIETCALNGTIRGSGSGFLISPDGLAITNYHVVADSGTAMAVTSDGTSYLLSLLDGDPEADLALVKLDSEGVVFPYLELNTTDPARQGQPVYAIGSPLGLDNTMSQGIVSNPSRVLGESEYIQISVPIAPGSSGGALLNEKGQVIGITSAGFMNSTGDLNLAIPTSQLSVLDFTATEDNFLFSLTPYPCVDYVPDFGEFSGVRVLQHLDYLQIGAGYVYDMKDFYTYLGVADDDRYAITMYLYDQYLTELGFTEVPSLTEENNTYYSRGSESVRVTLDYDKMEIWVMPMRKLQRYAEVNVLDFGWCIGQKSAPATMINGSYVWEYPWWGYYSAEECAEMIDQYLDLLEDRGFSFISTEGTANLFESKDYSLVLTIGDRSIFIDILPLR